MRGAGAGAGAGALALCRLGAGGGQAARAGGTWGAPSRVQRRPFRPQMHRIIKAANYQSPEPCLPQFPGLFCSFPLLPCQQHGCEAAGCISGTCSGSSGAAPGSVTRMAMLNSPLGTHSSFPSTHGGGPHSVTCSLGGAARVPPAPDAARFAQQPIGINNSPCLASSIINVHQPRGEGQQEQPQPGACALGASPSPMPPAPAAATLGVPSPSALSKSPPELRNTPSAPGRASIKNWACLRAREDGAKLPQPLSLSQLCCGAGNMGRGLPTLQAA